MRWNMAGVGEAVGAFGRGEGIEGVAERLPEGLDGAPGGGSEQRLELGERELDRVQVGRVGRQIEELMGWTPRGNYPECAVNARMLDGLDLDAIRVIVEEDASV